LGIKKKGKGLTGRVPGPVLIIPSNLFWTVPLEKSDNSAARERNSAYADSSGEKSGGTSWASETTIRRGTSTKQRIQKEGEKERNWGLKKLGYL